MGYISGAHNPTIEPIRLRSSTSKGLGHPPPTSPFHQTIPFPHHHSITHSVATPCRQATKQDPQTNTAAHDFFISTINFRFAPKNPKNKQNRSVSEKSHPRYVWGISQNILPRNLDFPVRPPRAHIPSTATAAAQRSYHDAVSSGAVVSTVMVQLPVAIGITNRQYARYRIVLAWGC